MKDLLSFSKQVIVRAFTGLFLVSDAISLLLLITSHSQPKVPWQLSLSVFIFTVYAACYSVWHEQKTKNNELKLQLKDLKEKVPEYTFELGEIKKYTVKPLIEKYSRLVSKYEPKADLPQTSTTGSVPLDGIASLVTGAMQAAEHIASFMKMAGIETSEEKYVRFKSCLAELHTFEEKIKNIYQVEINIQSTRADKNIEIHVSSPQAKEMFVKDNYIKNKVPRTNEPQPGHSSLFNVGFNPSDMRIQSKLYLSSYGDTKGAFSKISQLNAKRELSLFDEDFYISTSTNKIELILLVHSEGRDSPQTVNLKLDLSNAVIESLEEP